MGFRGIGAANCFRRGAPSVSSFTVFCAKIQEKRPEAGSPPSQEPAPVEPDQEGHHHQSSESLRAGDQGNLSVVAEDKVVLLPWFLRNNCFTLSPQFVNVK